MQPIVSIIIPTYNRAHLINETLDSILGQTYENWECIIVDDGSTDDTEKVVESYTQNDNRFKFYKRPNDYTKGANSCRHIGFIESTGEFINWFDSDDIMLDNHLAYKLSEIKKNNWDFVVCEVSRFRYNCSNKIIRLKNNYQGSILVNQFIGDITFFTPGPLWRREFLTRNNLNYKSNKNESIDTVLNDWVFGLNALLTTENYGFLKEPLILYRYHENSIYGSRIRGDINKLKNEFRIRSMMYSKVRKKIGYDKKIETFMFNRKLKLLLNMLYSGYHGFEVYFRLLQNQKMNPFNKFQFTLYYLTCLFFKRGHGNFKKFIINGN